MSVLLVVAHARAWCEEHGETFERIDGFKNHYALISHDGPARKRRKFRCIFRLFSWRIRRFDWIDR